MAVRRGGASGATRPDSERRAEGRERVAVWLDASDARLLRELEAGDPGEGARSRIVRRALRVLHSMGGSGERA